MNVSGFWDENLDVPTIDLSTDTTDPAVYDPYDAMAQGTATVPDVVSTATSASSSGLTFSDILNAGKSIVQAVTQYHAATLPTGQRIYTMTDPRTGLQTYGGATRMYSMGGMDLQSMMPWLLVGGVALLALTGSNSSKGKKRESSRH